MEPSVDIVKHGMDCVSFDKAVEMEESGTKCAFQNWDTCFNFRSAISNCISLISLLSFACFEYFYFCPCVCWDDFLFALQGHALWSWVKTWDLVTNAPTTSCFARDCSFLFWIFCAVYGELLNEAGGELDWDCLHFQLNVFILIISTSQLHPLTTLLLQHLHEKYFSQ